MTPDRARRLVLTRTRLQPPSAVPELVLHLADDMHEVWTSLQREFDDGELPPPFWAFAWVGGQALARHLLDTPAAVAGRRVVDVATGSGLCALAAARAGASQVTAVDVDPVAVEAVLLNAEANGTPVAVVCADLLDTEPPEADVLLAGDVFYDVQMSQRVQPWLLAAAARGTRVLVGDPGRGYLPRPLLDEVAAVEVPTTRELEGVDVKTVRVYAVRR